MKLAKDDPILIVGGGLAGITTAAALKFYEFTNVHIFEKEPVLPVPQVPVQLGANALWALNDLSLAEMLQASGQAWQRLDWLWKDGKALKEIELNEVKEASGFMPHNVAYPDLHRVLQREMAGVNLHLGQELLSYTLGENMVEAHFADGHTEEGALLIGADGINSRVRLQLMGRSEVRTDGRVGYHALLERGFLPEPEHEVLAQPQVEHWGPDKLCVLSANSGIQAGISVYLPAPSVKPESVSEWLHEAFKDWDAHIADILQQVPEETWVKEEITDIKPIKNWYDWRVVVTGDAAHPAYPYLGQSVSMTLESGITLARALNDMPRKMEKALKHYQKLRRSRTKMVTKSGQARADSLSVSNKLAYTLRNAIMPRFAGFLEEKTWLKLNKNYYYK